MTDLLAGNLVNNSTGISWKGKFGNQTYHQLQQKLYANNYTGFLNISNSSEDIFFITRGFCKKLIQTNSVQYDIHTRSENFLLIVDPNRVSRLRIKEMDNSRIDMGPTDVAEGHYTYGSYEIRCTLHNHAIQDGTNCVNYENLNSSFEDCVESKLRDIALKSYDCLPPWLPQKECSLHIDFRFFYKHIF